VSDVLLDVREVTKTFPGNRALDAVSLTVKRGEIVALLGHNGSGKSTLVKVLSGNYTHDSGEIVLGSDDRPAGIHFIHQNLGLIPNLTVIENLDLGIRPRAGGLAPFNHAQEKQRVQGLIADFGVDIDADARIASLTPAEQTIVAIVRAFDGWSDGDNVLVLDEPTAALHGDEVITLQNAVRSVAAKGAGIVYISHRLGEVVELADRVIVLKDGKVVAERERGHFDQAHLVEIIAGGEIPRDVAQRESIIGPVQLEVRGLVAPALEGVDFVAHAGEILGISGLVGSGMEHLNAAIFGSITPTAGAVSVGGSTVAPGAPPASIAAGVGFVPADRRTLGSIGTLAARENITLPRLSTLREPWGAVNRARERAEVDDWMTRVHVHPAGFPEQRFDLFSGGNQQKIVLAKWLRLSPRVLLLDEPTQGVDAGAQAEIYELLVEAASAGAAVVVSSSDTKELAAICDRVLVMRDGRIAEEFTRGALTESALVRAVVDDGPAPTNEGTR
jgi:ABC-type sugar transport system ATPase subunit